MSEMNFSYFEGIYNINDSALTIDKSIYLDFNIFEVAS